MSEKPAEDQDRDQVLKEVQSWWEIASIAQFVSLFRESFNLPEIEIEELEEWFIDYKIKGSSKELQNLIFALLRTVGRSINEENWESQLQKLVHRKWPKDRENPFPEGVSFSDLSLRTKVEIIYDLCHYRFDRHDIETIMKSMDAEALRVQKLGMDDIGNTYWYFYGTRLYKEEYIVKSSWDEEWKNEKKKILKKRGRGRPRKIVLKSDGESDGFEDMEERRNNGYMNANEKSRWSVVCNTMEEWVDFAEKFKNSKSKNEKALFLVIQKNFLPTLSQIYEEKEKKLQQKIRELMPVRERIVTRRETRRQRGELQQSPINGYEISDEAHKLHLQRDRARRLEERNKRATEFQSLEEQKQKRPRYDHFASEESMLDAQAGDYKKVAFSRPENDFQPDSELETQLDLQTQMEKLLSNVKLHKDAWPFLFPVREEQAPGYFDIIKEPVDLSLIESKLYDGHYETVGELDADFSKMVANCQLYNGENHVYSKMAHALWKTFRRGVSKILDSLPEEVLNAADGEQSTPASHPASSSSSSRGHSRKPKDGKKRRKQGMDPLEMLAHASEIAIQTANSNDMQNGPIRSEETDLNSFSSLKVTSINSHPPSLVEKFSSDETNEGSSGDTFDSNSSYASQENVDKTSSSPSEANYADNLAQNFPSFVQKNSHKEFNILSNSEMASSEGKSHLVENPENVDHGLDNILGEENMTNFLSNFMYNSENQLDNSMDSNNGCLESTRKQDINKLKKTPTSSSYLGPTVIDNNTFFQDGLSMSSSTNTSAVDASTLNIPPNSNLRIANTSTSQSDKAKSPSISTAGPPKPTFSYRAQVGTDESRQAEAGYHLVQKRTEIPIQHHSVHPPKPVGRSATTFAPSVASTLSQVPYQVTTAQTAPQHQESSVVKLNVGAQNPTVMFVPSTLGNVTTYRVYAESNSEGAVLSGAPSLPVNPQVPSGQESITINNQAKSPNQVTSPQTLESIMTPPQRISPAVHQGPLSSPSSQSAAFNSPKTTLSISNTSFMPVNSLTNQFQSNGSLYPTTTVNSYPTSTTSTIQNGQFQGNVIQGPRTVLYQSQPASVAVGNASNVNSQPAFQQVMFQSSPQQAIQMPNGTRYIISGANVLGNKGQVLQIQNSQGTQAFGEMMSQVVSPGPLIQVAKSNATPSYQLQTATQSSGQPLSQVQPAQYMNIPMYMLANQTVPQAAPTVQSYQRTQIQMNGPHNR